MSRPHRPPLSSPRAPAPVSQTGSQPLSCFAVLFQKLSVADCPLYLRLLAGPDTDVLSFVLKENETGEVEVGLGPWLPRNAALGAPWGGAVGGRCPHHPHRCSGKMT